MEYQANKPYPKVEVKEKNIFYATLLLEDYAGMISESTAIFQYIYERIDKFQIHPEFSEALFRIAVVEMRHLQMLGETITLLGLKPEYKSIDSCNYPINWNSSFVNYNTDITFMLKYDIQLETKTIEKYKNHIQIINDPYIKRLLHRIIEDEEIHIQCFQTLLAKYGK